MIVEPAALGPENVRAQLRRDGPAVQLLSIGPWTKNDNQDDGALERWTAPVLVPPGYYHNGHAQGAANADKMGLDPNRFNNMILAAIDGDGSLCNCILRFI